MIAPFSFDAPVPLAFGENRITRLGRDVKRLAGDGARVVLVVDPVLVGNGLADRAMNALTDSGHAYAVFSDIRSDPSALSIDAIVDLARSQDAGCIVAMGGGSTMDAAKLAGCLAGDGGRAETYALGAEPLPRSGLPKIAIPTTSGTGSEVTRTSVFSTDDRKLWAWGNELRFSLALLDPALTSGMPADLTAATGIDAMVHAIESATCRRRNPVSTTIALGAIRALRDWLPEAVRDPANLTARGHVQIAATLAGIAFDVTGVAVAHSIGHALGQHAGVHHGRAVGLALAATMQESATAAPDAYSAVSLVLGAGDSGLDSKEAALAVAPAYRRFIREIGLKVSLEDYGLKDADAQAIASLCFEPENRVMLEGDSYDFTLETLGKAIGRMLVAS